LRCRTEIEQPLFDGLPHPRDFTALALCFRHPCLLGRLSSPKKSPGATIALFCGWPRWLFLRFSIFLKASPWGRLHFAFRQADFAFLSDKNPEFRKPFQI
jgi:hypothetical protein